MAGMTLEQAQTQLDLWLSVSTDIANNGQSTAILGRQFTAANLDLVQKNIEFYDTKVKQLSQNTGGAGIRLRGITPV